MELDKSGSPGKTGPEIWVRRLVAGEEIDIAICSPAPWPIWTHWCGNHSEPCYTPHEQCPGHRRGYPRRWKGYLAIVNHTARRLEFLEITAKAADSLKELAGEGNSLRGLRVKARRGKGDKARLAFSSLPEWSQYTQAKLPADVDPEKTLVRLWGMDDVSEEADCRPVVPFAS